jgi:hypothetical protein
VIGAGGEGDMLIYNGALFRCDTIAIGTIPGSEGSIVVGLSGDDSAMLYARSTSRQTRCASVAMSFAAE